jgi:phosphoribosylformimino-5-aminoimidazole carboxamide ribotide isomerase
MTSVFDVIPAIDLRDGRVVRLEQGDFDRETVFDDDPAIVAARFAAAGARFLHVVDLDGASAGEPAQLDAVRTIARASGGAIVEAAGGIRSTASVDAAFGAGAGRVVFGTAALRDADLVRTTIGDRGADRVAVAVDVREGRAVGDAWQSGGQGPPPEDLVRELADLGVEWFEVTAIDRDGLLGGPDLGLLERIIGLGRGNVIASGGIRSVTDAIAVRDIGCAGAIVGRALYTGAFDLAAAIATFAEPVRPGGTPSA